MEMKREYQKWWSPALEREMELLIFGHSGRKVLVFPTRGGRFYEYEDLRIVQRLASQIEQGEIQLFCIDGIDAETFYCFWAHPSGRINRYQAYEDYVINEVIPFINEQNQHPELISHGCSLGAFHAANIAFKYPKIFTELMAFSGRYDLTLNVEYFSDLFNGFYNEDVYFNTPTHFLPNLSCPKQLAEIRNLKITLVIGQEDPFFQNNLDLCHILNQKDIQHNFYVWEERAHTGYYWRRMASIYFK
ncbi:esterase family protein [Catenovulum maritimum]|nr:alpha/beta hydrolase-fold protein [Catenovulum maritimum]